MHIRLLLLLSCTSLFISGHAAANDNFSISGFARFIAGKTTSSDLIYEGFEDSWKMNDQSLIAIQPEYEFNDKWQLTTQLLYTENNEVGSELEWAYLSYKPNNNWQFRLGKLRTPFLSLSDVIHVGYAYHWVQVPNEVNTEFFFSSFEGGDFIYSSTEGDHAYDIQGYFGKHDDKLRTDNRFDIQVDAKNFWGIIGSYKYNNFSFRTSYHQLQVNLPNTPASPLRDLLKELNFHQSADALDINNIMRMFQISFNYDSFDHFFRTEALYFKSRENLTHSLFGIYASYGYQWDQFSIFTTLALREDKRNNLVNDEIPANISPELDMLRTQIELALATPPFYEVKSISLGGRWDVAENWAIKAEIKKILTPKDNSATFSNEGANFDGKAGLFSFAIEWVF